MIKWLQQHGMVLLPSHGILLCTDFACVINDLKGSPCFAIWAPIILACLGLNAILKVLLVKVPTYYVTKADRLLAINVNLIWSGGCTLFISFLFF